MQVNVTKRIYTDDGIDYTSYKLNSVEFCCEDMQRTEIINFGNEIIENCHDINEKELDIGMRMGVLLKQTEEYTDPYEDYSTETERFYKINCCPFCGKPIVINIQNCVHLTKEYQALKQEQASINKKTNRTDSRRKLLELTSRYREICNKMSEMSFTRGWKHPNI